MNNLLSAIVTKSIGSSFYNDVGGRMYLDQAPDGCEYPYCVFFVVSRVPDNAFSIKGQSVLIQFSLFSSSSGATEITGMYNDLNSLFDECSLTITSNTLVWIREVNLTTMVDEITTADASTSVKHWAVDFEITTTKP